MDDPVIVEDDWTSDLFKAGRWDLWAPAPSGGRKLISTVPELLQSFRFGIDSDGLDPDDPVEQRHRLRDFLSTPAAVAMPARLREAVDKFLAS